jgi:hypothetical protein
LGMPHTDLAILKDVRRKLEEAQERLKSLGDEKHPNELEVHLQTVIDRVHADIEALQNIVGPHEFGGFSAGGEPVSEKPEEKRQPGFRERQHYEKPGE